MTSADILSVISALVALGSLGGAIFAIRKAYWEGKKEEVSTAETYENMADRAVAKLNKQMEENDALRQEVHQLRKEVEELKSLFNEYEKGMDLLIRQLEANQLVPAWKPKKKA